MTDELFTKVKLPKSLKPRKKKGPVVYTPRTYTNLFIELLPSVPGPYGLKFDCPSCGAESSALFKIMKDGGFMFKCKNTGCEFNDTVWFFASSKYEPGDRACKLFTLLGGDKVHMSPYRFHHFWPSILEMHEEFLAKKKEQK